GDVLKMFEVALALRIVIRVGIAHDWQVVLERERQLLGRLKLLDAEVVKQGCQPLEPAGRVSATSAGRRDSAQRAIGILGRDDHFDRPLGSTLSDALDQRQYSEP